MYNAPANGIIKREHKPIIDSLLKIIQEGKDKDWPRLLPLALFADRTLVYSPIEYTSFYIVYGYKAVLSVKLRFIT